MRNLLQSIVMTAMPIIILACAAYGQRDVQILRDGNVRKSPGIRMKERTDNPSDRTPYNLSFVGEGVVEFNKKREQRSGQMRVTYYQFQLKPWVDKRDDVGPIIEVGGAAIRYRYDAKAQAAELMVAIGREERGVYSWKGTGAYKSYNIDGSLAGHTPFMLRVDRDRKVWDLYVNHRLLLAELPLTGKAKRFRYKSKGLGETSLRGMTVGDENPLFVDEDCDGIPDEFSAKYQGLLRSDIVEETGASLLEEFLAQRKGAHKRDSRHSLENR